MNKIVSNQNIDQLYHYGINGQKWGKRRFQNPDGTRTSAGKKREQEKSKPEIQSSDDYKQSKEDRAKATKGLSNEELKRLNSRMALEKTYRDLSAAEKKKGESLAKGILKDIAKQSLTEAGKKLATDVLTTLVSDPISKALKDYVKDKG